ncbi:DUF1361 domain-containing protein [Lacinutrix salivirga]
MKTIEYLLTNRFKTIIALTTVMLFSIVLLMVRIKLTQSYHFLFLVWNLFLATIPFAITCYLLTLKKMSIFTFSICFTVWLLFLPNAPYIITDLFHLRLSNPKFIWLDVLVISTFAISGLLLFYFSIIDFKTIINRQFKKFWQPLFYSLFFLSSFGMYLGRFLRYNSWEILNHPQLIILDIWTILTQPSTHSEAWLFTIIVGAFLSLGYWLIASFLEFNVKKL